MITTLTTSYIRVGLAWYVVGLFVLFLGNPEWAEAIYRRLSVYPWVPQIGLQGITTAMEVQWTLLAYWTIPLLIVWGVIFLGGWLSAEGYVLVKRKDSAVTLTPRGAYYGVYVPKYSIGNLPLSTVPALGGKPVTFIGEGLAPRDASARAVTVKGSVLATVKLLTPVERELAEELVQLLVQAPDHYAGLGHGVGLLEHTFNVVSEAAEACTAEFRLPFLAALAHDIGKLVTFKPDGKGGWAKRGLHTREGARILATLPAFLKLSELEQRALILAIQFDHAPTQMPALRGDMEPCRLAIRIISALSKADRQATADEKDRNLARIEPEDILWHDFVTFLREAPMLTRGKKGAANQLNHPEKGGCLFIYEGAWREAAIKRLPDEVAAALDLNRRDVGKLAKYTRILSACLRKEGLLVERATGPAGESFSVTEENPLWDINCGTGEKAIVFKGVLVVETAPLWKKLNYKLSTYSPLPVSFVGPNSDPSGRDRRRPKDREQPADTAELGAGLKVEDYSSIGLGDVGVKTAPVSRKRYVAPPPEPTIGLDAVVSEPVESLSFAEKRAGIRRATAKDVQKFPHLIEGEKFYPETSRDVIGKRVPVGSPFGRKLAKDQAKAPSGAVTAPTVKKVSAEAKPPQEGEVPSNEALPGQAEAEVHARLEAPKVLVVERTASTAEAEPIVEKPSEAVAQAPEVAPVEGVAVTLTAEQEPRVEEPLVPVESVAAEAEPATQAPEPVKASPAGQEEVVMNARAHRAPETDKRHSQANLQRQGHGSGGGQPARAANGQPKRSVESKPRPSGEPTQQAKQKQVGPHGAPAQNPVSAAGVQMRRKVSSSDSPDDFLGLRPESAPVKAKKPGLRRF